MPKPSLKYEFDHLESEVIETMIAGLHEWRADLNYPESHSDMQACVRGAIKMFDIKRRPLGLVDKDIVEPSPVCEMHGRKSQTKIMGVYVCGPECAQELVNSITRSYIEPNLRREE